MSFIKTEQCCNQKPIAIVEYDLGSLGKRIFKVCNFHIKKEPWNRHIISSMEISDY